MYVEFYSVEKLNFKVIVYNFNCIFIDNLCKWLLDLMSLLLKYILKDLIYGFYIIYS